MRIVEFQARAAAVRGYVHDRHPELPSHVLRPALLICPGGAYRFCSPREGDPVALHFFALGYNVFLVEYSCGVRAGEFRPLRELAAAMERLRCEAAEWNLDPGKIAVLGFSAGGHLAASLGVYWNDAAMVQASNCRPDALVLCYPVITTGEFAHRESAETVSGGDPALLEKLSLERHAGAQVPPAFLWHTVDDPSVPVENTLLFASALRRSGVPFECHLFAHGDHGLSMCNQEVETPNAPCAAWVPLCETWLNSWFAFTP